MVVIVSEHLILDFYLVFVKKKAMAGGVGGFVFLSFFFLLQSIDFMISLFYVSLLNYNYHSLFYCFRSRG